MANSVATVCMLRARFLAGKVSMGCRYSSLGSAAVRSRTQSGKTRRSTGADSLATGRRAMRTSPLAVGLAVL